MLRWLIPIATALVLIGQSVTAWAAAGTFSTGECCCPIPKKCWCSITRPGRARRGITRMRDERNKGQTDITVQLKIELFGEMTWSGWQ